MNLGPGVLSASIWTVFHYNNDYDNDDNDDDAELKTDDKSTHMVIRD